MRTIDEIQFDIEDLRKNKCTDNCMYCVNEDNKYCAYKIIDLDTELRDAVFKEFNDGRCVIQEECQFDKREYGYDNGDVWECSECGLEWEFTDGNNPFENDMNFCPSCGRKIKRITWDELTMDYETVTKSLTKQQAEEKLAEMKGGE